MNKFPTIHTNNSEDKDIPILSSNIINLTSHSVTIITDDNVCHTFPTSGNTIRMINNPIPVLKINSIPVVSTTLTPSYNPPRLPNTYYIVSTFVGMCMRRPDFLTPDTSTAVRDDSNRIIATQRFQTFTSDSLNPLINLPEVTSSCDGQN